MERCCPGWQNVLLTAHLNVEKKSQKLQVSKKSEAGKPSKCSFLDNKVIAACMLILHNLSASLTGSKAGGTVDTPQSPPEKEAKQEEREAKPGHPGYEANKKLPYIDK